MQLSESHGSAAAGARRKRAAVELIARDGPELKRTARRYSICEDDAEDAYQRTLEILLVKAPSERPRDLIRWTKTVIKHEALAIRRNRERLLGRRMPSALRGEDPTERIPAAAEGPEERAEGRELVARSREALRTLKPAELRALALLAAGCSYAEIGEITGFSRTKVNRCLAEGRERFRRQLSRTEDGTRCAEMGPLLSAFCDGEAGAEDAAAVRAHLRACAGCRATMRAYRSAPAAAAALAPALPVSRSLLERVQELLLGLQSRLPGAGGASADAGMAQVATGGGARGIGAAAAAKLLAVCAGTVGGAACVATGVAPVPLDLAPPAVKEARVERVSAAAIEPAPPPVVYEPAPPSEPRPEPADEPSSDVNPAPEATVPAPQPSAPSGAVEYAPPPVQAPSESAALSDGGAAGEFGP
jgi:RNA polymerase sigma factor (sigma-70 family)